MNNISANTSGHDRTKNCSPPVISEHHSKGDPPNRSISGLEKKYRETLGELKKLREEEYDWQGFNGFELAEEAYSRQLQQLNDQLAAVEKTIRLFDPEWRRKRQMAPLNRGTPHRLRRGAFKKAVMEVLREAVQPLTVAEIAQRAAIDLDLPMQSSEERQKSWMTTYAALQSLALKNVTICLSNSPSLWLLALKSH